jgi:hypothetical protein
MLGVINAFFVRKSPTETKTSNHVLIRNFHCGGACTPSKRIVGFSGARRRCTRQLMRLGSNIRTLFMQRIAEVGGDVDLTKLMLTLENSAGVEFLKIC